LLFLCQVRAKNFARREVVAAIASLGFGGVDDPTARAIFRQGVAILGGVNEDIKQGAERKTGVGMSLLLTPTPAPAASVVCPGLRRLTP
jgi:hypothetical protein